MKNSSIFKKIVSVLSALMIISTGAVCTFCVSAEDSRFNSSAGVDYTNGTGASAVLTHRYGEKQTAVFDVNDARLTRNAVIWMSMTVDFENSESWGIRFRNVTCKLNGETLTGDLVFRLFKTSGIAQVDGKTVGIKNWAKFKNINGDGEHKVVVCSSPEEILLWIDGVKATGTYFADNVTDMTSNYTCPQVFMGGYNTGTIKNIRVWNNGTTENPVMPADKVNREIAALNSVSSTYRMTSEIISAQNSYNALSKREKKYVTNYSKLEQILLAANSEGKKYDLTVSGSAVGNFKELFPGGTIMHNTGDGNSYYYFDSDLSRNSKYYIQFDMDFSKAHCFDVYLRNQTHKANGTKVSGKISIRFFDAGAVVLDSSNNHLSEYINFNSGLMSGAHTVTVCNAPDFCCFWIDGDKYVFEEYLSNIADTKSIITDCDCIQALPGFYLGGSEQWGAFGKIGNISVWNDQKISKSGENAYSAGDEVRIGIYNLPALNEITLADEKKVASLRAEYDALSKENKKYVTNINVLEKAERGVAFIKESGNHAYCFLRDDEPVVQEDDINYISTSKVSVLEKYSKDYKYNNATHNLSFTNAQEYITASFKDLGGFSEKDTYLIRFDYTPYEYYYETASASWMGLRITFSGYTVGGNGATFKNKCQFAFMTKDSCIISQVNNVTRSSDYLGVKLTEPGNTYHVSMLCEAGKMKIWVNGKAVAYFDQLAEYVPMLEFEASRCRCDVNNIQVYNYTDVSPVGIAAENTSAIKIINDVLYDSEGQDITEYSVKQRLIFCISSAILILITLSAILVFIWLFKTGKLSLKKNNRKDADINERTHE